MSTLLSRRYMMSSSEKSKQSSYSIGDPLNSQDPRWSLSKHESKQTVTGIGQSIYKYSACVNLKNIKTFFMKLWTKTIIFLTVHIFVCWTSGTLSFQDGLRLF